MLDVTTTARAAEYSLTTHVEAEIVRGYLHPNVEEDDGVYFIGYLLDEMYLALAESRPATIFSFGKWLGLVMEVNVRHRRSEATECLRLCFVLGPCTARNLRVKVWRALQFPPDAEELPF